MLLKKDIMKGELIKVREIITNEDTDYLYPNQVLNTIRANTSNFIEVIAIDGDNNIYRLNITSEAYYMNKLGKPDDILDSYMNKLGKPDDILDSNYKLDDLIYEVVGPYGCKVYVIESMEEFVDIVNKVRRR